MANDLAVIKKVNGTSLEPYRDRDEVRELAQRLLSLHPAASEVGEKGMTAVAQLALMIGASPLPGVNEIHVWVNDVKGAGKKVQFQLGINYYRRKALEFGGVLWQIQPRQMDDRERKEYGIHQGQLAAICRAVRITDMEYWLERGLKANQIFDMLAITGTATAGANEGKHGRPAIWTAFKRAEVDMYRQLFPTMQQQVAEAQFETKEVVVETDPGPNWDEFDPDATNDLLFGPDDTEPAEAEYEEIPEPEPEETPEDETPEPEPEEETDPNTIIEDCRSWLQEKIKNDKTTLGMVIDAVDMTGLYNGKQHIMNAVKKYEGLPDTFKFTRSQVVTGGGAIKFYNYLTERKAD